MNACIRVIRVAASGATKEHAFLLALVVVVQKTYQCTYVVMWLVPLYHDQGQFTDNMVMLQLAATNSRSTCVYLLANSLNDIPSLISLSI
jgi:hypothetical protein